MAVPTNPKAVVTETLRNLQVAIKSSSLYSISHPTASKTINTIFDQFQKHFEQKDVLVIQIQNGMVFFDRTALDRDNVHAKNFSTELTERNVTGMMFQKKLSLEELRNFMKIMGMKASKLDETGGLQKALASENIHNIKVSIFVPSQGTSVPMDMDMPFGGLPLLPEMAAFANYFVGKEQGLGGFEERFFRESMDNPKFMAQVITRAVPEDSEGEHPVVHYLRSLERIAASFSPRVGGNIDEIKKVLVPVALSFDEQVKDTMLTDGREYAKSTGAYVSSMYQDLANEIVADRVRFAYSEGKSKGSELGDKVLKLLQYVETPKATVRIIEQKLKEAGMTQDEIGDVLDHVYWDEYTLDEKFRRLMYGEKPWSKDFDKVYSTILELLKSNKLMEAVVLFRSYMAGLRTPDESIKREIASKCLKLIEPFPRGDDRENLMDFLAGELTGCLRSEAAQAVCEALIGSTTNLMRSDLVERRFIRVRECMKKHEEMLLAFDIPAWKTDLIKNGLRQIGDASSLNALVDALHESEGGARDEEVVECINALGPSIIEQLINMLAEEQDRVRRARIVESIQIIGSAAENAILASLNDDRWYVVRNLTILLGDIGGERSIFSLEKVLNHKDSRVVRAAIRSLNKIGTATASRVLGRAIERGSDEVRAIVIPACAVAGNEAILPQLLDIVRGKPQLAGSDAVRKKAIEALGKVGSRQAVKPLAEILEKRSLFTMAEDVETRLGAVRALGAIGGDEAVEALERAARKDPKEDVRHEAARLLEQIGQ